MQSSSLKPNVRKARHPKRHIPPGVVPKFSMLGKKRKGVEANTSKKKKTKHEVAEKKHSKFFFDMLLAMDRDVMSEYVMPHVFPTFGDRENLEWLGSLLVHGEGGGLYQKSVTSDFLFPCRPLISKTPLCKDSISTTDYIEKVAKADPALINTDLAFAGLVKKMYTEAGVVLDVEFEQCAECRKFCAWGADGGYRNMHAHMCERTKTNPMGWTCVRCVEATVNLSMMSLHVPMDRVALKSIEMSTTMGRDIVNVARMVMNNRACRSAAEGPCEMQLINLCGNDKRFDRVALFIRECMKLCTRYESFPVSCNLLEIPPNVRSDAWCEQSKNGEVHHARDQDAWRKACFQLRASCSVGCSHALRW